MYENANTLSEKSVNLFWKLVRTPQEIRNEMINTSAFNDIIDGYAAYTLQELNYTQADISEVIGAMHRVCDLYDARTARNALEPSHEPADIDEAEKASLLTEMLALSQADRAEYIDSGMFNSIITGYLVLALKELEYPEDKISEATNHLQHIFSRISAEAARKTIANI